MAERPPLGTLDVSASGGRCELIGFTDDVLPPAPGPDLALLETVRENPPGAGDLVPASADGPFFAPGQVLTWHYRRTVDVARVIRDDAAGLVCWTPNGAPRVDWKPDAGNAVRDLPLHERFTAPGRLVAGTWHSHGIVRVAPTGEPFSVWLFWTPEGDFAGWYLNLELPHQRPAGMVPGDAETARVHSGDLVLDLWVEGDQVWLKDEDELAAAVTAGRFPAAVEPAIRACADRARAWFSDPGCWVRAQRWEDFRPGPELDAPVAMPDNPVTRAVQPT